MSDTMYKFKKIFIFVDGEMVEAPNVFYYFSFTSYDNAREFLHKKGFQYYMFTLKKVS